MNPDALLVNVTCSMVGTGLWLPRATNNRVGEVKRLMLMTDSSIHEGCRQAVSRLPSYQYLYGGRQRSYAGNDFISPPTAGK